jgi:hypothetical protein
MWAARTGWGRTGDIMRFERVLRVLRSEAGSESGAVTVDWVVLTAALVGLGVAVAAVLGPSLTTNSGSLNRQLNKHQVHTDFNVPVAVE